MTLLVVMGVLALIVLAVELDTRRIQRRRDRGPINWRVL